MWIKVVKYLTPFVLGGLLVYILIPSGDDSLETENKLLYKQIETLEKGLLKKTDRANTWEKFAGKIGDSLKAERSTTKALNIAYRKAVNSKANRYTQRQIDSVTNVIVKRYETIHPKDSASAENIVIKTAEDGIKCDSTVQAQEKVIEQGERFQAAADSTMKSKDDVIASQVIVMQKQDSLTTNQKVQIKSEKKTIKKLFLGFCAALVVAIAESLSK